MKRLLYLTGNYVIVVVMAAVLLILGACTGSKPAQTTTVTVTPPPVTVTATPPVASPVTSPAPSLPPVPTPTPVATPVIGTPPPEVTQFAKDWPLPGRDYANSRSTKDATINSSNIGTLGVAWIHNVPSGQATFGSMNTTPIIMGNNVYIQDIGNNVFALDKTTGKQIWQTVYNLTNEGPDGACVGYGKVFASSGPYDVVALDSTTGKEIWRTTLIDPVKDITQGVNGIDMQPTVYDGLVYVSTVPGNAGVFYAGGGMGILYALDQATGKIVWSFNTVYPTDWVTSNNAINSGGGVWYSPAVDTATGQIYWDIANPGPFPGQTKGPGISQDWPNGTSRPGPNLYTNSVMAFDHATGKLTWYNQVWPHDIADYDLQIAPMLGSANYAGKQQDIVIAAGKMGRVYAFNRQTCSMLWTTNVGLHNGNDELAAYPTNGTVTVLPGSLGGVETPMAYSDGVAYVCANNIAIDYINGLTFQLHPFSENTADLVAIDVNTGHILWDNPLPSGGYGGATVVNDLVFTGTFDGMLYAFNRTTGAQVWSYQAPAGVNAWPAAAGDTLVWPIGGPGVPSVIGFKLGATAPAITLVNPSDKSSLAAGDITVTAEAVNIKLVDKLGKPSLAGEGHIHFFLDADAPTTQGQPAVTAPGTYAVSANATYTWKNVPAGQHTLSVELVNNDHTPLNPPVVQKITINTDTNPRLSIINPKNGGLRNSAAVIISTSVSNFNLTSGVAQGKIVYYLDIVPPTTAGQKALPSSGVWAEDTATTHTFNNLSPGIHKIYVQLVDNNDMPLSPAVTDSIQVYAINYTGGAFAQ